MSVIVCQACGTENPDGATYCKKCATRLDAATQQSVAERRSEHVTTGIRWSAVIAAIIVLFIVIAVIALFATHTI